MRESDTFRKSICPKMNLIVRFEFVFAYSEASLKYFNHLRYGDPPSETEATPLDVLYLFCQGGGGLIQMQSVYSKPHRHFKRDVFCSADSTNECPGYDIKQSDGEVQVMLELWKGQVPFHCHRSPQWVS